MTSRLVPALAATPLVLALAVAGSVAAPANADGPALADGTPTDKLVSVAGGFAYSPTTHRIGLAGISLTYADGRDPAPGTVVELIVSSCGQVIKRATITQVDGKANPQQFDVGLSPSGKNDTQPNRVNNLVGDNTVAVGAAVTEPGYAPYPTSTNELTDERVGGPTCAQVADPSTIPDDPPVSVARWSTKKGATSARVGKRLAVTATRAPGAGVAYDWKVGKRIVARWTSLAVKPSYRGKKVSLRITVSKTGFKPVTKILRYGKAR